MSEPFLGEIRTVCFLFAPVGWARCDGQLLPIAQNTALYSLLGTNYGGDGETTFALPRLNGSAAIGQGQGPGLSDRVVGEAGGTPTVMLLTTELPAHGHGAMAVSSLGSTGDAANGVWAEVPQGRAARRAYAPSANTSMAPAALAAAGGSQPHNNMPPFLTMTFVIALQGILPPR